MIKNKLEELNKLQEIYSDNDNKYSIREQLKVNRLFNRENILNENNNKCRNINSENDQLKSE